MVFINFVLFCVLGVLGMFALYLEFGNTLYSAWFGTLVVLIAVLYLKWRIG